MRSDPLAPVDVRTQVLGVEALICRDVRQTHALLLNHLNTIRGMPLMNHTTAVLSFECALQKAAWCHFWTVDILRHAKRNGSYKGVALRLA